MTVTDQSLAPPSKLPLIAMGALAVLAIVVGLGVGLAGTTEFDEGTPEAALQDFLDASLDADGDAVLSLLVADRRAVCDRNIDSLYGASGVGFELDDLRVTGDTAAADVSRRRADGGDPFGGGGYVSSESYELRRNAGGEWQISSATWPNSIARCLNGAS